LIENLVEDQVDLEERIAETATEVERGVAGHDPRCWRVQRNGNPCEAGRNRSLRE
jgi:hypothetical protein